MKVENNLKIEVPMKLSLMLRFVVGIMFLFSQSLYAQKSVAEFITSISPPVISDTIPIQDGERYITYNEGNLFVVNLWSGVQIFDISHIESPQPIKFIQTKDMVHHIDINNNRLFIANEADGILVFDISNRKIPVFLGKIETPGSAFWVRVQDPYLFVALGNDGFCIMDISDLNNVRTLTLEIPGYWVWSLAPKQDRLYVAGKQGGLLIYDISNPASPKRLTQYKTGYQTIHLQVENNLAYIADGPGGLLILDVSVPSLPKEVARFKTTGFSNHVFKSGNYVYLSNRELGLLIINVSDPKHPYLDAHYIPESETYCSFKQDIYVFLTTDTRVEILRHNNRPILESVPDVTIDENSSFVLKLKANDPDGDPITFKAENLPEGAEFNNKTGLFTWTPTFEQSGVYPGIVFRVIENTASQLSASDTINITVNHVNRLPNLPEVENKTIPEDSLLVIQIKEATDPDSEDIGKLKYRAENLPEGAEFDPEMRQFRWKPTFDQSGVYVVDFVVEDGMGGVDRNAVTITVEHVDRPPVLQPIADRIVDEGQTLTIRLVGEELDKEDQSRIEYTMLNMPEGASFNTRTGEFVWTPTYDQAGTYENIIAIMKAGALSDSISFSITVNHVNRPPVLTDISDLIVDENSLLKFSISGSDPDVEDTGKIVFTAQNLPEGARFDPDSLIFSWRPNYDQSGVYSDVTFVVTDPSGLSDQKTVKITVNHVNRPPVLAEVPELETDENVLLEYQLSGNDPDREDEGKLAYSATGLPEGASVDPNTGHFSWTPNYEQSGNYQVTFFVSDGQLTDSKSTTIVVHHVNRPPVLNPLTNKTIDENQLLTFKVTGNDPDKEDAGQLIFEAKNLPEGATFDPQTQIFSWTPTFEQSGMYSNVLFRIKDPQGLTDEKKLTITVNHVNRSPSIEAVSPITVNEMEVVSFTLVGVDPDKEDAGQLKFQILNLPEGATLNSSSGAFRWTPTYDQAGEYALKARVVDSGGLSAETTINVLVNNVNRPPRIEPLATVQGKENSTVTVQLKFSDPDKEDEGKIKISVTGLPEGATLDKKNGIILWKPNYDQSGSYTINYIVTDNADASAEGSVILNIENVNRAPKIRVPSDQSVKEGENLAFKVTAEDPDKEDVGQLEINAEDLPEGAHFNNTTGEFSWTPGADQQGEYELIFKATDPGGLSDTRTVKITVIDVQL